MTIASLPFLGFAAAFALLYNLARPLWWRELVFLAANIAFLATFSLGLVSYVPLACFLAVGYAGTRALQAGRAGRVYWLLLAGILAAFCWLKKHSFFPAEPLAIPYVTIGLSYIFFRVVHVLIDARDGNLPERIGPVGYLNYLLNFTALVSGPIQRWQDYRDQQQGEARPALTLIAMGEAVERIAIGFFKTIVLSSLMSAAHGSAVADLAPAQPFLERAATGAWAAVSYTIYLYFNFSGYTDIVIGVARFFRLELPENFNRPFQSKNFLEFWSRWHMSLSEWFKAYLYNPMVKALMKRFPSRKAEPFLAVATFFVTFFLIGLWHGSTPIFAVYGLLLGLGASVNKLWQVELAKRLGKKGYKALAANPLYANVSRGLNFTWLSLSLVCFWADGAQIATLTSTLGPLGIAAAILLSVLGWALTLALWDLAHDLALSPRWNDRPILMSRYIRTAWATALVLVAVTTMTLMASPAPDVVYKTF
jgi:D-alanyl-lipoteichoic acid acyltransferase DltB (MBOAT superfamily)